MATTTRRATEADLWEQSARGQRCELVDGQVRVMSPAGFNHGLIAVRIGAKLLTHVGNRGFVVSARSYQASLRSASSSCTTTRR